MALRDLLRAFAKRNPYWSQQPRDKFGRWTKGLVTGAYTPLSKPQKGDVAPYVSHEPGNPFAAGGVWHGINGWQNGTPSNVGQPAGSANAPASNAVADSDKPKPYSAQELAQQQLAETYQEPDEQESLISPNTGHILPSNAPAYQYTHPDLASAVGSRSKLEEVTGMPHKVVAQEDGGFKVAPNPKGKTLKEEHAENSPFKTKHGWKKTGEQMGSNPGGVYTDSTGAKHYVKFYHNETQAKNEVVACRLYEALGIKSAQPQLVSIDGQHGIASPMLPDAESLPGYVLTGETGFGDEARDGFVADAFLANHDVVGMNFDNMMESQGSLYRIDNGGALLFRAQGGEKANLKSDDVPDLDTMRDPAINPQSAQVFGSLTDAQMKAQAKNLVTKLTDQKIAMIVAGSGLDKEQQSTYFDLLKGRRDAIAKRFKVGEYAPSEPAAPPAPASIPDDMMKPVPAKPVPDPKYGLHGMKDATYGHDPSKYPNDGYASQQEGQKALVEAEDAVPGAEFKLEVDTKGHFHVTSADTDEWSEHGSTDNIDESLGPFSDDNIAPPPKNYGAGHYDIAHLAQAHPIFPNKKGVPPGNNTSWSAAKKEYQKDGSIPDKWAENANVSGYMLQHKWSGPDGEAKCKFAAEIVSHAVGMKHVPVKIGASWKVSASPVDDYPEDAQPIEHEGTPLGLPDPQDEDAIAQSEAAAYTLPETFTQQPKTQEQAEASIKSKEDYIEHLKATGQFAQAKYAEANLNAAKKKAAPKKKVEAPPEPVGPPPKKKSDDIAAAAPKQFPSEHFASLLQGDAPAVEEFKSDPGYAKQMLENDWTSNKNPAKIAEIMSEMTGETYVSGPSAYASGKNKITLQDPAAKPGPDLVKPKVKAASKMPGEEIAPGDVTAFAAHVGEHGDAAAFHHGIMAYAPFIQNKQQQAAMVSAMRAVGNKVGADKLEQHYVSMNANGADPDNLESSNVHDVLQYPGSDPSDNFPQPAKPLVGIMHDVALGIAEMPPGVTTHMLQATEPEAQKQALSSFSAYSTERKWLQSFYHNRALAAQEHAHDAITHEALPSHAHPGFAIPGDQAPLKSANYTFGYHTSGDVKPSTASNITDDTNSAPVYANANLKPLTKPLKTLHGELALTHLEVPTKTSHQSLTVDASVKAAKVLPALLKAHHARIDAGDDVANPFNNPDKVDPGSAYAHNLSKRFYEPLLQTARASMPTRSVMDQIIKETGARSSMRSFARAVVQPMLKQMGVTPEEYREVIEKMDSWLGSTQGNSGNSLRVASNLLRGRKPWENAILAEKGTPHGDEATGRNLAKQWSPGLLKAFLAHKAVTEAILERFADKDGLLSMSRGIEETPAKKTLKSQTLKAALFKKKHGEAVKLVEQTLSGYSIAANHYNFHDGARLFRRVAPSDVWHSQFASTMSHGNYEPEAEHFVAHNAGGGHAIVHHDVNATPEGDSVLFPGEQAGLGTGYLGMKQKAIDQYGEAFATAQKGLGLGRLGGLAKAYRPLRSRGRLERAPAAR